MRILMLFLCLITLTLAANPAPAYADRANWDLSPSADDWNGKSNGETTTQDYQGFSSELFWKMSIQLQKFHEAVYPGLMQSFGGFIRIFVTLYIVVAGYGIASCWFKEATKQMMTSIGLVIVIHATIMESNTYSSVITPTITGLFMNLSDFFAAKALAAGGMGGASDAFGVFAALDEMISRLDGATKAIEATAGMLDFLKVKMWFAIINLTIIYAFLYGAFMGIMVMGFFSLHILYLVGGICMFFAAFHQTRFIFWSWLRGIFNYGLLIVFASIVLSICIFGLNESLAQIIDSAQKTREIFTREYFFAVFWALVSIALILKVPDFASQLSGGSAGSTAGIAAGMGLVTSSIAKGVKMGMGPAGKMGGTLANRGAGWAANKVGAGRAYSYMKGLYKGDDK